MRVHELAKELGLPSKDLITQIRELGGDVKSHMTVVDVELLTLIQGKIDVSKKSAPAKDDSKKTEEAGKGEQQEKRGRKKADEPAKPAQEEKQPETKKPDDGILRLQFPITVGNFADLLKQSVPSLIKTLMSLGIFANVNQLLNDEIGHAVAEKLGVKIEVVGEEEAMGIDEGAEDASKLVPRPPVVTMMGHVDHGKTSLLDAIRKTNVASREKGAITQHVGAYNVAFGKNKSVTFLDTPGHEAFTAMRARGANVTDVVVLVVAADDGVMPQTVEAIHHATEAGCPIVVAINKSDLPTANPDHVMRGLQQHNLAPEEWGGKTVCVKVSAKTGAGIQDLLEMLSLETDILELKANPEADAAGTVIEAHLSKGSGPISTVIVQRGTLRVGDMVVCGNFLGRVRALKNDLDKQVREAGPSYAVQIMGLNGVPDAGDKFVVVPDEKKAREIHQRRVLEKREKEMSVATKHLSLENLYEKISEGNFKELKIIIKADVQGSSEALAQSLEKLSNDQCHVRVIHSGVGGINESDVVLAAASDAVIIAFHVKADAKADSLSRREGVDIRRFNIIYEAVESVRQAMEGLLSPTLEEVVEGHIELRQIFKSSKIGNIGGGMVLRGKVKRNNPVRIVRDDVIVYEGKIAALKRFKDDVREVSEGYECGISFANYNDIQEGDVIESYRIDKTATKLEK